MPSRTGRTRFYGVLTILAGILVLAVSAATLFAAGSTPAVEPATSAAETSLNRTISAAQAKLRRTPQDPVTWAQLGSSYVEQARLSGDPVYYAKAQGALDRSLQLQPEGNGLAMIGLGALANARHDFAAARDWGERAKAVLPDTAEVYGVLADAHTQLGDTQAATDAVQRMLDLKPGVPAFTRAAYDLEIHGQTDDAASALDRALAAAVDPADITFCRYHLGALAFDNGALDTAEQHYEAGLRVDPRSVTLLSGRAKVAAARGRVDDALAGYRDIIGRVPLPEYLHEYALLLTSAGRTDEATQQFAVLAEQDRLLAAAGASDDLTASVLAADRGEPAEALRRAEAEWQRRQNVLVADALAWALHLNGRDAEALEYTDRAAATGWRNATFTFHRGMILAGLGRDAEAANALDLALRINPHFSVRDTPVAQQALVTLRSSR